MCNLKTWLIAENSTFWSYQANILGTFLIYQASIFRGRSYSTKTEFWDFFIPISLSVASLFTKACMLFSFVDQKNNLLILKNTFTHTYLLNKFLHIKVLDCCKFLLQFLSILMLFRSKYMLSHQIRPIQTNFHFLGCK